MHDPKRHLTRTSSVISGTLLILALVLLLSAALCAASYLREYPELQTTIAYFGYPGIIAISTIAGLNVIIPFPAASLVPIFTTAGLHLPFIIFCLTAGTVIADFIGYTFGRLSSTHLYSTYPRVIKTLETIYHKHQPLIIPVIFLYAAFVPLPNEVIIIPLAILGMKFRYLLLPLILGDFLNQALYAYGIQNVFSWWF